MSEQASEQAQPGGLFVISAPSGAGKTTLVKKLVHALAERGVDVGFSISYTTRPKRPTETHSKDYFFVAKGEFARMAAAQEFLEHAEVFGNCYGTAKSQIDEHRRAGRDVILEIDWQGADQVRARQPDCVSIFILPPSQEELERRLRGRGEDSEEVIAGRLAEAFDDMGHFDQFDYVIVNDCLDTALEQLLSIFLAHRQQVARQRLIAADLLQELTGKQ